MSKKIISVLLMFLIILVLYSSWNDYSKKSLMANKVEKDKVIILSKKIIKAMYANNQVFLESIPTTAVAREAVLRKTKDAQIFDASYIEVMDITVPKRDTFEVITTCTTTTHFTEAYMLTLTKDNDVWILTDFEVHN